MSAVNDKQISGDHYKTSYQHWDMLVSLGYGPQYYVGQATKYLTRWRKKNGVRDLRKGQHFIEKLLDLVRTKGNRFLPYNMNDDDLETELTRHLEHMREFFRLNEVDVDSQVIITGVAFANCTEVLEQAIQECERLAQTEEAKAKDGNDDKELPVSRGFEFHGYTDDDHINWKCKHCGADLKLSLMEPPLLAHSCNIIKA